MFFFTHGTILVKPLMSLLDQKKTVIMHVFAKRGEIFNIYIYFQLPMAVLSDPYVVWCVDADKNTKTQK